MSGLSYSAGFEENYRRLLSTPDLQTVPEMLENDPAVRPNTAASSSSSADPYATPPKTVVTPGKHRKNESDQVQKLALDGIGIVGIILEQIISHPFTILKRQCQVNRKAQKYHLTPVTLAPIVLKLVRRQGIGVLWKGAGSVFIVRGLTLATETAFSDLLGFPRDIFWYSSIKQLLQNAALKTVTCIVVTPFVAASLVETVQSDIASEKPGVLDCLKEGFGRIFQWGKPRSSRLLPIWLLIGPTFLHGVLHYAISSVVRSTAVWYMKLSRQQSQRVVGQQPTSPVITQSEQFYIEMASSLAGSLMADAILYPMETVLHRLYVQGTRSIVDNLDTGLTVTTVVTKYDGFFECFQTVVDEEGASGLYKGLGAVIMQYVLQVALLKGTKAIHDQIMAAFQK